MISIIIPTLNEERYIGRLLVCLCSQKFKNFEVIIVDGKSTDCTIKVAKRYRKSLRLKTVESTERNLSYQRNLGVDHSQYDNLLFLDADVKFGKSFLNKLTKQVRKRKLDIATGVIIPDSKKWYYKLFFTICNLIIFFLQKSFPAAPGSFTYIKKEIHQRVKGHREDITWSADISYVNAASKYGKFGLVNVPYYFSVRRFEQYGTKKTMFQWAAAFFLTLINKPEFANSIKYDFGKF